MAKNANNIAHEDTLPVGKTESRFTKEQILKSGRYQHRRDMLEAVLEDGETYSHGDVEKIIDEFMRRKVT